MSPKPFDLISHDTGDCLFCDEDGGRSHNTDDLISGSGPRHGDGRGDTSGCGLGAFLWEENTEMVSRMALSQELIGHGQGNHSAHIGEEIPMSHVDLFMPPCPETVRAAYDYICAETQEERESIACLMELRRTIK